MTVDERRFLHTAPERRSHSCEFRLVDGYSHRAAGATSTDGWTLSAYAALTGQPYKVYDKYGAFEETLHRGTFRDTLAQGASVHLLVNHAGLSLGRTTSGTLRLWEDARGLPYEVDLDPMSPNAVALRSAVIRRDVTESSFAFQVTNEEWNADYSRRQIYAVDLHGGDVSPVNNAANPSTGDAGNATSFRSDLSTAQLNDLPDNAWAYIEPGGTKDSSGKTVPRSKRHFCIVDAAHVRAALARIAGGAAFGKQALPAVLKAAKKFGINAAQANAGTFNGEYRSPLHPNFTGSHSHRHPANGSQGGDKSHHHQHDHDGNSSHDHHAAGVLDIADADAGSDSTDRPNSDQLSKFEDYDYRLRIARLRIEPPPSTRERAERRRKMADVERVLSDRRHEAIIRQLKERS